MPANRQSIIYTSCYALGVLYLAFQAVLTVYQLGTTISDSQRISRLQQERQELAATKTTIEQQATSLVAISTIDDNLPAGYTAVVKPLIIRASDSVASR